MITQDERIPQILKMHEDNLISDGIVLNMRVAGTTFVDDSAELLMSLKSVPVSKISLSFQREPTNQYDPNAVRVYIHVEGYNSGRFIGYIPRDYSELISYVICHIDTYKFLSTPPSFIGGTADKENIGVFFNIKILKRENLING